MRKFTQIYLFLLITNISYAQQISIKVKVVNDSTHTAIIGAYVVLYTLDSTALNAAITNIDGHFLFENVNYGDYRLIIDHVSYTPKSIDIFKLNAAYNLEEIRLTPKLLQLEEVLVVGKSTKIEPDRYVKNVTKRQKEISQNGFDLMHNMALPGLSFDFFKKSISSPNGKVLLQIDGVNYPISELETIQPEDVLKIEYIDQPGIRYGDSIAAVINIKTRKRTSGVQGGINTLNMVTSLGGDNSAYVRFSNGKDLFTLSAKHLYLSKRLYSDKEITFHFPKTNSNPGGETMLLKEKGVPHSNLGETANAKIGYNRKFNDKLMLNADINYSAFRATDNKSEFMVEEYTLVDDDYLPNMEYQEQITSNDYRHNIALDLYLEYKMREKDALIVNVTGTSITSDYDRGYINSRGDFLSNSYIVDGNRKSLITEIIYERNV